MPGDQESSIRTKTKCPVCRKDDKIEKVSSIYSAGVQAVGGEVVGAGSMQGLMVSKLATRLAPPQEPQKPSGLSCLVWGLAIGAIALLLLIGIGATLFAGLMETVVESSGLTTSLILLGTCGISMALLVGLVFAHTSMLKKNTSIYENRLASYQTAKAAWEKLYYCSRDDIVYNPEGGEVVEPEDISTLF